MHVNNFNWTAKADINLVQGVYVFGKKWADISEKLFGNAITPLQCQEHYPIALHNLIFDKCLLSGNEFTPEQIEGIKKFRAKLISELEAASKL